MAILSEKVAQGGAALFDRFAENLFNLLIESNESWFGDVSSFASGFDAGSKERLRGIDVTNTHDGFAVHDVLFDGCLSVATASSKVI